MTSQGLSSDDRLPFEKRKDCVIVQVEEIPLGSPGSQEACATAFRGLVKLVEGHGMIAEDLADISKLSLTGHASPAVSDLWATKQQPLSSLRRTSSFGDCHDADSAPNSLVGHRKPCMHLPLFNTLGIASSHNRGLGGNRSVQDSRDASRGVWSPTQAYSHGRPSSNSWPPFHDVTSQAGAGINGLVGPLTPPEDADMFKWSTLDPSLSTSMPGISSVPASSHTQPARSTTNPTSITSTSRPSTIQLPQASRLASQTNREATWLERASSRLITSLVDAAQTQQIQMVVQALPAQWKGSDRKPVFEEIVENIQRQLSSIPYITITHAVSQVVSMEEVPASPPATPNNSRNNDDYFDDQTIFTHAAVVPTYHSQHSQSYTMAANRATSIIAAPLSINISTLERYIPPTSAKETSDFFSISRRSYLADRMVELSAANGSLLLVYPTKIGAETFSSRYIGPVLEPFLRQFVMLNNLFTTIASDLGTMEAIPSLLSFEEMMSRIRAMCDVLGQRPSSRIACKYEVIHAETTEVVLDRRTWVDWFVDQEQPRLRQNLVNYHKAGGRMPARSGVIEVTPGTLVREVVEGIRSSREPAGDAGIEVGVFVIRRSTIS